jgi:hypothetical protein
LIDSFRNRELRQQAADRLGVPLADPPPTTRHTICDVYASKA